MILVLSMFVTLSMPAVGEGSLETVPEQSPAITQTEETRVSETVIEDPVVEEPASEEPIINEEPVIQEPIVEEPVTNEEPVTENPVIEEPVIPEPVVDVPVIEEPVVVEPTGEEPTSGEPLVEEPVIAEPVTEEPVIEEPAEEPAEPAEETEDEEAKQPEEAEEEEALAEDAESLVMRSILVGADEMAFRDQWQNPTEPLNWSNGVWYWLYGRGVEPVYNPNAVLVEISGMLPETVTAVARYIEFADAEVHSEVAMMMLDVALYDADGMLYQPTEPLYVSVGSGSIDNAISNGKSFVGYFNDADDRGLLFDSFAAAITVRTDEGANGSRLVYTPGQEGDSICFRESGDALIPTESGTLDFEESGFPFRVLLSAQQADRTLYAESWNSSASVVVEGPMSENFYVEAASPDLALYDVEGSSLMSLDVSLALDNVGVCQPEAPVTVTISDSSIAEAINNGGELQLWSVESDGMAYEVPDATFYGDSVAFETGNVSQYIIQNITLSRDLVASDGSTYEITVTYPPNSGIPSNAELYVEELLPWTDAYYAYLTQSAAELGVDPESLTFARAFDITLVDPATGMHYQPNQNVQVSINLINTPLDNQGEISVLHFNDVSGGVEAMDYALNGEAIEFQTGGFSVFMVMGVQLEKTITASDGNTYRISVTYDAAAGLPRDAELYVTEILEGDARYEEYVAQSAAALGVTPENLAFARAFDITLENPRTGEEYQPNGSVQVSIELLMEDLNRYASVDVIHISDVASEDAQVMETTIYGEAVRFETSGFSVYVLTGSNGEIVTPQCTYTFYVPDPDRPEGYKEYSFTDSEGRTIFGQIITSGDELFVPVPTSTDNAVFAGWYQGSMAGGTLTLESEPYDFENITITENSAVDLYAVYTNYATVIFHDQYDSESGTFPVAFTRREELVTTGEGDAAVASATVKISDLSTTYTSSGSSNMAFFAWSETPITTPGAEYDDNGNPVTAISTDAEGCITVTEEKHLYPIFRGVHRLTYYAAQSGKGADYVPPADYFAGEVIPVPLPVTSMEGFTFDGWYTGTLTTTTEGDNTVEIVNYGSQITNSDGSLVSSADDAGAYISSGKLYLRADTTLYAHWTAKTTADYQIIIWKQNPSDDDDLEEESKTYSYAESEILNGTIGTSVSVPDDYQGRVYKGYSYSRCDDAKTITADGSMVLNVYYDKKNGYTPSGSYTLRFVDSITEEGKTSKDLPVEYMSISYDASITDKIPSNPTSGRNGYVFSNWYFDQACTIPASLSKMPDYDLTVYAGWETGWYVVTIDPNYGALYAQEDGAGTGATWFWSSFEGEPIGEYTHVTRDFVESSSGTWYYVDHSGDGKGGDNGWTDRHTYYTQNPALATEDTTFEYAPGVYTYVGWYEVFLNPDGNEIGEASEPYDFSKHVDHNTKLRLHWKKAGTYYLAYEAGDGTLEDGTKRVVLSSGYADYSAVVLTQSANAPTGYTFIGWKVRGSESSVIYKPGQTFILHADDAKRISGKDIVFLDAVYTKVGTATIIYDANGGTISADYIDYGKVPGSETDSWVDASGTADVTAGTATVSGLANNSRFKLSDGTGFAAPTDSGATFLGWSDKAICDDSATFYSKNSDVIYGVSESTTLYAVWSVQVTYNLNSENAGWGDETWDSAVYTFDNNIYSQNVKLGNVISEPDHLPVYSGSDGRLFCYWATRTGSGTDNSPYHYTEYDFSQPITGAVDLYAYWGDAKVITVHAVDASDAVLAERGEADSWTVTNVTVATTATELTATSNVTPAANGNYEFAFVAVASDLDSVSESNAVTAIKYENKKVKVKYAGESAFRVLSEGRELYFVFYQKKALNIGYKSMASSGVLENVTTSGAPETTNTLLGTYDMSSQLTAPLSLATGFTYYAFAIGSEETGGEIHMNASKLSLITNTAGADDPTPTLQVRNTWRGLQYTMENGENADWVSCGYAPQLYVVYYSQHPTLVMFHEKTVGTSAVMDTAFTFNLLVTAVTTTITSVQTQMKEGDSWVNDGEPDVTTESGEPVTVFDTTAEGNHPFALRNGEAHSSILFYGETSSRTEGEDYGGSREVTTITTVTAQSAVITQTANDAFTTSINGTAQESGPFQYTFTAIGSGGTVNVTFTNTHKALPVEVHVAMVENDGTSGGVIQRDSIFRSTTETAYQFDLALGTSETILTRLPSDMLFTGDTDTYAFSAVMSGTGSENAAITVGSMDVASIAYAQTDDGVYELVLKDGDGNTIGELGSNKLYYLYYPMPKIRYVKETSGGTLTDVSGCLVNPTTGSIEESDSVTYNHALLTMNGKTVEQNECFELPLTGFTISQSGNNFRMPPVLDDGIYERYLSYVKLGAGSGEATNISALNVSDGLAMQLKVQDSTLQYSFDGMVWTDLSLSGTPTIYAIYTERGYDFQISKTVDTSQSGENAIFSDSSFTATISSMAITKESYDAEGAEFDTVTANPATATEPGTIVLSVADGTKVRIKGLGRGDYTITESENENYTLTARTGPIVGSSTSPMTVTDNSSVSFTLDTETKVDLTNSPKAICKIDDHYFYTLRSMVDYVENNIATKTANAEMLTDYLMPAADTVEIPNGCDITLTTIEDENVIDHPAIITRTTDLSDVSLFTNNGTLTITNLTLEGNHIVATDPMIRSTGDLSIGSGATIQNVVGGGAINAAGGNIAVSGMIQNCSAAEGGAIYHSGNSTVTLSGTGSIQNNTATSGNGGAIYISGGTVMVSGTSKITGNKAESGNGGAVYCSGAVVVEIDQGGSITGNTAKEGGAVYAETGMISISKTADNVAPAITGNTATNGNGGAIHIGTGSVSVHGGSVSNNTAENGQGGGIYTNTASVMISGTAEVKTNRAKEGGAVYASSGAVAVSGGTVDNNTASTGNGGAIYAGSGNVAISGGSLSGNTAMAGSGGAIHAGSGNVTVSGGSLSENTAETDGGAINATNGTITLSVPEGGTAVTVSSNTATTGNGGAICAGSGAVSITGITLTGNSAGINGGAVYANTGAITAVNSTFGGAGENDGNTAGTSGGAIYADSGNVTVSGGSMAGNTATAGDGGAIYAGSGVVTVSDYNVGDTTTYTQFANNSAASGKGGAVYLDSGSLTLTTVTATDNRAINGAAVFVNTGRANFSAGSYTVNTATDGGAIGMGSTDARLYFTGDVQVKDNKLGTEDSAPGSNVYLDRDEDAIINIDTLGTGAAIGIYVADNVENTRGVPGSRFAVYTSNDNISKITNDRYSALTVQSDTAAKKLYWGNDIKVSVHSLTVYDETFAQPASNGAGTQLRKIDKYYPEFNDASISELATELVNKNSINIGTSVYAGAYLDGERSFGDYITQLTWHSDVSEWYVTKRDGETVSMKKTDGSGYHRIYIYYAQPAYISIENNTDMTLSVSGMTVSGTSVINTNTVAGYGMVFAKNGAIRSGLLPVTEDDLKLTAGQSITLLIPGGQNKTYTLDGQFTTSAGGSVRLRRTDVTPEETLTYAADGTFDQLTGTTLNSNGTYKIIFGDDKYICKVVDSSGVEHPYSRISDAIADIVATAGTTPPYALVTAKTATIEMLTDYLLPASDYVLIPRGYDITLTTAVPAGTDGVTYTYSGESTDGRAVISRDSENKESMIDAWNGNTGTDNVSALDNTVLRINKLVFDGKSVRGSSDGGAVKSKYVNVYIDHVDFKNVYASNGGAMLIMFSAKDKNNKATVPNTVLEVKNSIFTGCTSTTTEASNRLGGGAIVTNAETMTLENCIFDTCSAVDQAGAVFHRVDGNYNSWTIVTGCTFTNCSANAAGGLELDSKNITVTNCTFNHCVASQRNGGGFNVYALNNATPSADCWVTVSGCTFNDCQLTTTNTSNGNGGGFRCNAVYTTVENSTFTNNQALYGGGFCISNGNAKKGEVYGCSFERCTAGGNGGGIFGKPTEFIIGDYIYTDDNGIEQTRHTEIKNCTSKNHGGGLYHDRNADNTSLSITNAVVTGNRTTAGSMNGGGVFTNCRKVEISGSTITDNTCTNHGGGVYSYSYASLSIADSDISRNISSGNGAGVWFEADNDTNRAKQALTIKGSIIDSNTSGGNGGGVYTQAKIFTIGASETQTDSEGKPIRSSVSNNTAKIGGGIYQTQKMNESRLEISDTSINGNTANNGNGGGIYAGVRTLTATLSEFSRNTATGDGGGVWFDINDNTARDAMSLTVEGCTLDGNTSGSNGGGIYTNAKTVEIKAHTVGTGEDTVTTGTKISNCTTAKNGGGIYQNRDVEGSVLTVSGTDIKNNTANSTGNELGGGGVYANVRTMTLTDSEVSGNTAAKQGGGIYKNSSGNDRFLIVDHSTIKNNTAGDKGGGVYDRSQLALRNGVEISGNRLTTNTAENCAGVFLENNRTLYVGPSDAEEGFTDTIIVRGNTVANGTLSDLRLWDNGAENNSSSAYVYCHLSTDSEIRVVNAAKVSTWFGSSGIEYPSGFSDDNAVFKADSSTLHGIIDRTDLSGKKIIWAGPPIAKLTDGNGKLLYIKYSENGIPYPAIFDRLDTGNTAGSTGSPFSLLRMDGLTLYYKDGTAYTGSDYCIKMLVERYDTSANLLLSYEEGRNVTLTTALKSDTDGYPYEGPSGGRATVIRGSGVGNNNLLVAESNLTITNIIIDGGSENGISANSNTRNLKIDTTNNITVMLGEGAILQNAHTSGNGGCVYLDNSNAVFEIAGGVIRNCSTTNDGGGVYVNNGKMKLTAGSIYQCSADSGSGGGVRMKGGSLEVSGGSISVCSANKGGGVYLGDGNVLNMSGGSIINNSATKVGGGVAVYNANSRLYFSGKVNISGNTSDVSVAKNHACNIELNQNSKAVINTNSGGLYAGAYIGVYVPGDETTNPYKDYGGERDNFGTFVTGDNTSTFYSFVNDRNGLKGGIIENPSPNTIYWIQIFSLEVSKEVISGNSTSIDENEAFLFEVNIRGNATVTGQLNAKDIDSSTGDYGQMQFTSNGTDTTRAVFALKNGESITGVNLSEGLTYEVIEYLTIDQAERYAAMPMNGYRSATETLIVDGAAYTVIRANTYTSTIGENKSRTDVDPYTSSVTFTNLMPVCKITDMSGNILYRRYDWDKVTNKASEGQDGGSSTNQPYYYAPAVYTELTGNNGAFKALEGTLYTSSGSNPTSYSVGNGVQIQMLIGDYNLNEAIAASQNKVTLTTASAGDALFPKQDAGTTSTIRRSFAGNSMFEVSGDLTFATIILDGMKGSYTVSTSGGIANVLSGGKLTIQNGAVLQNSRTAEGYNGAAVYVADGGSATMTGGMINRNESAGDGAGIYLANGSMLSLSGTPSFGGTGRDVSGNITTTNGNFRSGNLIAQTNGGKNYTRARQDIYIAESQDDPASVVLTGNLDVDGGSIWIWAETENHYAMMKPFARINSGTVNGATYAAFRNARPDSETNCGEDSYLSGSSGENAMFIYWTGGFDVRVKKINGFGAAMAGATFMLYTDLACTEPLMQGGVDVAAVSADGTATYEDKNGTILDEGIVLFEQISAGVYYMRETVAPNGYLNALTKDAAGNPVSNVYIVLVGDTALQEAGIGILADITHEQIIAQTGTGDDKMDAAVFLIDPSTGMAVATPDIARYGIMNIYQAQRKVILRKTDDSFNTLQGATFDILRYDHSVAETGCVSGTAGAIWIGNLPYGIYYLHETSNGTAEVDQWFTLTVNETGAGNLQSGVFSNQIQLGSTPN